MAESPPGSKGSWFLENTVLQRRHSSLKLAYLSCQTSSNRHLSGLVAHEKKQTWVDLTPPYPIPPNPTPRRNVPSRHHLRRRRWPFALRQQIQHCPPADKRPDEFRGHHKTDGPLQDTSHRTYQTLSVQNRNKGQHDGPG